MDWHGWFVAITVFAAVVVMATTWLSADAVLVAAVGLLLLAGVLTPQEALIGLTNEGLATIAVLYVLARGVTETGFVNSLSQVLLGRPRSTASAQMRLMLPVAFSSAFMNNTPIVAMLIPAVADWAKRYNLHVSQLMIPLSYAAIIGGTCTLIGTSTNLIINGLLRDADSSLALTMFELAWVGVPCVVMVIGFCVLAGPRLLPKRGSASEAFADARRYTLAMTVNEDCPLIGEAIEDAGLRNLPGMFLVEINRGSKVLPAVSPHEVLQKNDVLVFAGAVDSVVDLHKIRGLVPATNQVFKVDAPADQRSLVEVVVSPRCPLVGKSIKEGRFRTRYNAAVIAVARDGEHLQQKVGDIVVHTGDMLLLETHHNFAEQQRNSQDFLLASRVEGSESVRHERRFVAGAILLFMVTSVALGLLSLFKAAVLAAGLMVLTRCTTITSARRSVDVPVLLAIAAAMALGHALQKTGVVEFLASGLVQSVSNSAWLALAGLFFITALITALVSNVAAAVILFPVALAAADQLEVSALPFVITLMIAASASFATPIGYQTNLMVYAPGGYKFHDFIRIGLPLTLLVGAVVLVLVPRIWPF